MLVSRVINCTRGYFEMLFAGLSLIYCLSLDHKSSDSPLAGNHVDTLNACAQVLLDLSDILIDARPYAYVFGHIKDNFITEIRRPRHEPRTTSLSTSSNSSSTANLRLSSQQLQPTSAPDTFPFDLAYDPTLPPLDDFQSFPDPDWMLPTWSPSMYRLIGDVEADVNQYAVGDWSLPNALGWDPQHWV